MGVNNMDNTMMARYLGVIEESELDFYVVTEEEITYVATEDTCEGQVIVAEFNIDGDLMNLYADLTVNSLDQFRNEYVL
jgi:hypothetical protein